MDVANGYEANLIVGKYTPWLHRQQPVLLNSEILEKRNHATITGYFNECMFLFGNITMSTKVSFEVMKGSATCSSCSPEHVSLYYPMEWGTFCD